MNTRLQVEHPVTELAVQVRGRALDLVELQLRVAAGEELPFTQDDVTLAGHAIEARVYAEDPFHGFLPQAGRAVLVRWPQRARVDAALESGQEVSTAYDPMLGKVVAHGPDREAARRALVAALDDTAILGLTTNVGFLRILAASDEFRDATIDTAWLDHATVAEPDDDLARVYRRLDRRRGADDDQRRPAPVLTGRLADGRRPGPGPGRARPPGPGRPRRRHGWTTVSAVWQVEEHLAADHTVVLTADGSRCRAVVNVTAHAVEVVLHGHRHVFDEARRLRRPRAGRRRRQHHRTHARHRAGRPGRAPVRRWPRAMCSAPWRR